MHINLCSRSVQKAPIQSRNRRKKCAHRMRIRLSFSLSIHFFVCVFAVVTWAHWCTSFSVYISAHSIRVYSDGSVSVSVSACLCLCTYINSEFCLYLMNAWVTHTWENYFNFNSMSFGFLCLCAHRIPYKSPNLSKNTTKNNNITDTVLRQQKQQRP